MGYNLVPGAPARTRPFIVLCPYFKIQLTREFYPSTQTPNVTFIELFGRMIDEYILIGLLDGRQPVQAANLIAQVQNGLAKVGTDEAGGDGDQEEGIGRELGVFRTHNILSVKYMLFRMIHSRRVKPDAISIDSARGFRSPAHGP